MSRHPETGLTFSRRFLPLFTLFQLGTFNDNALKNALIALITFGGVVFGTLYDPLRDCRTNCR
jgi:hypothetical protein